MNYQDWITALIECGVKEELISNTFIECLIDHGFKLETLTEENVYGFTKGTSVDEAGIRFTKLVSEVDHENPWLSRAIDWDRAWQEFRARGELVLVRTAQEGTWAVVSQRTSGEVMAY